MAKHDSLSRVLHGQVYISDKNITQNLILAGTLSRECSCSRRRLGAAAGSADKPTVKISLSWYAQLLSCSTCSSHLLKPEFLEAGDCTYPLRTPWGEAERQELSSSAQAGMH